jgi:sugar phosphate isomerase/epimerase
MHRVDERVAKVIQRVHINMPWKKLPGYLELVLHYCFNLEIGLDGVDLDSISRTDVRQTVKKLRKRGCQLSLHGPFWDLSAGSSDALIRQVTRGRLQQFFDLLTLFHPVQVVCHTGYDPRHHGSEWDEFLERSLVTWEPLLERAEILEIPLLLENVWEENPQFHKELFVQLPSPYLGFCLDVGHQHTFSKTPLPVWLGDLAEQLQEIHLHDNNGNQDAHLPVGQGSIDFDWLFQFLDKQRKTPLLTLEPHQEPHLFESLANLTDILERLELSREECAHGHCGNQHCPDRAPGD